MGMDFLDLLVLMQPPMRSRRRPSSPGERLTYAFATLIFPVLMFVLVLFAGLWAHPLGTLALGLAFVASTALVARRLRVGPAETTLAALGCALACFVWGGIAFFLGLLSAFYADF